jgi:pentatricopeptide repeat protein
MKDLGGVEPNEATYSCVIEALAEAENWRAAVRLYREAAHQMRGREAGIFGNFPARFCPSRATS